MKLDAARIAVLSLLPDAVTRDPPATGRPEATELLADAAVDPFPEQVGVPVVPGVLLDQMHQHIPQRRVIRLPAGADHAQVGRFSDDPAGVRALVAPPPPRLLHHRRITDRAVEVAVP